MSKRWAVFSLGFTAAAGVVGLGYHWLLRRPLPRTRGSLRLQGAVDQIEILRDTWGVPHIYANTPHDLFFAQGFVHAQDRLWQMELQRRLVAGRLSEVMGSRTLAVDRWMRTLCLRRVAEEEVALLDAESRAILEAYAAGVNARIGRGRLPIEFTLLRYKPEAWRPADSLSWSKMMSLGLSINWESEILRAQLIERLGPERAAELEPDPCEDDPCIIPAGVELASIGGAALDRAEDARPFTGPSPLAGVGSNNWVLSGDHTATGAPLLANDMHLPMNLPCVWYENHLVAGDLNVTGVTFPGIPGVVAGHNGHVAWGFTNGFPDVQDLFIERLRRTDSGEVQYEFKGEWLDAEVRAEEIGVKGAESVVEEVVITRHGPVINCLASELAGEEPLALRWTSLEPDTMVQALLRMMRARDCLEFREALRVWAAPVQNVVFADTEGNIAYSFPGRVPIRNRGNGSVPVPGWTGEYEWLGYVPFEELPHLYNPRQGYVATANNRVVTNDYPHFLGREYTLCDRALRIDELIGARDKIDVEYMQRMQFDQVSRSAQIVASYLSQLDVEDEELRAVVDLMKHWDGELGAGGVPAAVYEVFTRRMIRLMLQDKLGELTARYAGQGPTPLLAERSMFGERSWEWLQAMLAVPDSHWYDLGAGETRDEVMRLALRETVDFLKRELGPEMDGWTWGKLHTLTFAHTLGEVKPLDKLFNRGPYPAGGDSTTLWATGSNRHNLDSGGIIGPPFRFIADLGDLRNSWGLLAPGQSGQPGSRHYDDQIKAWFKGEYHPMLYAREDVEREAVDRLRLVPLGRKDR